MSDQAPLLYLAALLHDLGKVFGKPEVGQPPLAEEQRLEDWRRQHCPPTCSRSGKKCPIAKPIAHALRGAVYLLARGIPPGLRKVALLVLAHHPKDMSRWAAECPAVIAELAKQLGCNAGTGPDKPLELSPELDALLSLIITGDGFASSVSRVKKQPPPESRLWCSPYWAICRPEFQPVIMGRDPAFSGRLFTDWAQIEEVSRDSDFFSLRWHNFRSVLSAELEGTVEARREAPDVRLWSHAAFTAALALCYYRRQGSAPAAVAKGTETRSGLAVACLTFAGADRVAEVPSDGALQLVRGRAGGLSMLTAGFGYSLLRELGLPPECLLLTWDTGCFLLLYDTAHERLRAATRGLERELRRFAGFAFPRVTLAPVYVRYPEAHSQSTLDLRVAMRQAWQLAAYGHTESAECKLVYAGRPERRPVLVGATCCQVCRAPLSPGINLCPQCRTAEELGKAINQGRFNGWGWHPLPREEEASVGPQHLGRLGNLGVRLAPGGWPWRPPVGPGSPQQMLEGTTAEERSKPKIGIALVRCGAVEKLLSKMKEEHLQPARLAECFRMADAFFGGLHREEEGVWALRWSPAEALLMGRAEATLELLGELSELCRKKLGFTPEEMGLKVALAICPLDAPWREAVDGLRGVLDGLGRDTGEFAFLADGTPFNPQLAVKLLAHARQAGADGKYALDALQAALCRGLKPKGYDAAEASSALILLEARARGSRRQAVAEARKILSGDEGKGLFSALAGVSPTSEEILSWLGKEGGGTQAARALATLAVARRLLER